VVNSVGHFVHPFLTLLLTRKLGMDAGQAGFYVFLSALADGRVAWLPITVSFLHGLAEPVNDAMLTDLTTPVQRKPAFSLLYLGQTSGCPSVPCPPTSCSTAT
jgi:hypothetical protein